MVLSPTHTLLVGAADLSHDTTPQLAGALDAQSNNINSVGELGVGTAAGNVPSGVGVHIASSIADPSLYVDGSGGNSHCGIKINGIMVVLALCNHA